MLRKLLENDFVNHPVNDEGEVDLVSAGLQ